MATAPPIAVSAPASDDDVHPEENLDPILTDPHEWEYLAGSHPAGAWTALGFDDSSWKTGSAGFGYEDDDDETVLEDMKGKYQTVYLRQIFEVDQVASYPALHLGIRYDDAFIAYLNGKEVLRVGVGEGPGPTASGIRSHEAHKFELFALTNAAGLLRRTLNAPAGTESVIPWPGAPIVSRTNAWVALLEKVDAARLVAVYARAYPLFQQAYVELGYPDGHFNTRLVQVIDHLLAAPQPAAPVRLVVPKVLYEYADPALEAESAGRKVLFRMGIANAAKVKTKLRELRGALAGAG